MKRIICIMFIFITCMLLTGCWNYKGLDDIDIVTGIAIDKEDDIYKLTIEIVDMTVAGNEGKISAQYIESEGITFFDAIRSSKRKLINKIYGGNMQTFIISKQIAEEEGVNFILEELLRDGEPRETMSIVISKEETAREIFDTTGIDSPIISYKIHEMIEEDKQVTSATVSMPLYKAYNSLKGKASNLALPVIECVMNEDKRVVQSNGVATFHKGKLTGFIPADSTKYFLFIIDQVKGGAISLPFNDGDQSISMSIKSCHSKTKVDYIDGQVIVDVVVKSDVSLTEIKSQFKVIDMEDRKQAEQVISEYLEINIADFFKKTQIEYGTDIYGLGRRLYEKDPSTWESIEDDWDELFRNAQIKVKVDVDIIAAGVLKDY